MVVVPEVYVAMALAEQVVVPAVSWAPASGIDCGCPSRPRQDGREVEESNQTPGCKSKDQVLREKSQETGNFLKEKRIIM